MPPTQEKERRTVRLLVVMSPSEAARMQAAADLSGIPRSVLLRSAGLRMAENVTRARGLQLPED
jgi:hypothetical protein